MTKQAQKYDCLTGRIRAVYPPVSAADARKPLIHRGLERNLQENLLKYRNKGDRESDGLLLPSSSLMVLGKSKNPLQYSSYFAHVRSMPSAGERQALFEFAVWSLKLVVTCPSFRAQRSGVEKSFYAEPRAETAETAEPPSFRPTGGSGEISRHFNTEISHRFSQKFQSDAKLSSQASGLHGAAGRSWHAETAETAEPPRHFERSGAESRNPL